MEHSDANDSEQHKQNGVNGEETTESPVTNDLEQQQKQKSVDGGETTESPVANESETKDTDNKEESQENKDEVAKNGADFESVNFWSQKYTYYLLINKNES